MDWIKTSDKHPAAGMQVLTWRADNSDYVISAVDETGGWKGLSAAPTHWMTLPDPPMENSANAQGNDIKGDIIDGRMSLSMDEQRETVAELMQFYISGNKVLVNGIGYYVVDMENEIDAAQVVTIFYFRPATE
jgi:hypothetical protein